MGEGSAAGLTVVDELGETVGSPVPFVDIVIDLSIGKDHQYLVVWTDPPWGRPLMIPLAW